MQIDRLDRFTCSSRPSPNRAGSTVVQFKWDGANYDMFVHYTGSTGHKQLVVLRGLAKRKAQTLAEHHCGEKPIWAPTTTTAK